MEGFFEKNYGSRSKKGEIPRFRSEERRVGKEV